MVAGMPGGGVDLTVRCSLDFDVERTAELMLQVAAAHRPGASIGDRLEVHLDGRPLPVQELSGPHGNRLHVVRAGPGRLRVAYDATARTAAGPSPVTPYERVAALRPSRYCPSDRLLGFAGRQFGPLDPTDATAVGAAVVDVESFVHEHTQYHAGASASTTDAAETLLSGAGVCRDFAHLVATLARALDIPARTAAVYAPGLSPMDFHAVAEVAVAGAWRVVDATRLAPRPSMLRIATGADAAETAFATVLSGLAELTAMEVLAVVEGDLPPDDPTSPVTLP
jgi:transglutaminase-like putative cysteine protease